MRSFFGLATLCLALLGGIGLAAASDLDEFGPDFHLSGFCLDNQACEGSVKQLRKEWPQALKGDYQAQRNVGFCLLDTCYGAVQKNAVQACTWRIVLLASGSGRIIPVDFDNFKLACESSLSAIQFATARAQAARLYPAIYRRPLPPGPWSP